MLFFVHQQSSSKLEKKYINIFIGIAKKIDCKDFKILLIQNNQKVIKKKVKKINQFCIKVFSDNEYREFSAWERGINYIRNDLHYKKFNLILTNETMIIHRNFDKNLLNAFINTIKKVLSNSNPTIGGEKNRIPCRAPYYRSNYPFYISTYFLVCNATAQTLIKTFIPKKNFIQNFNKNFKDSNRSIISSDSELNDTKYHYFLDQWLYKPLGKYKWYAFQNLSENSFMKMRLKLISIIIEHKISQDLFRRKVLIVDTNYFMTKNLKSYILFFIKRVFHKWVAFRALYL